MLPLSARLSPSRREPGNIWKPHELHVSVALWCSESFPISDSQQGASVCFYQPCLRLLSFQAGLISGNSMNKHAFPSLVSSFVRRYSSSVCPSMLDPKRGQAIWTGSHIPARTPDNHPGGKQHQRLWERFLSAAAPPPTSLLLSAPHSFFTPLEVVLLTWVNKSFIVSHVYSPFVSAPAAMLHSRGKATHLQSGNTGKRAFCYWSERAASSLTISSILIGDKQPLYTFTDTCVSMHASHTLPGRDRRGLCSVWLGVRQDNKATHSHTHTQTQACTQTQKQQLPFFLSAFPLDWNSCGHNKVHFFASFFLLVPFCEVVCLLWMPCCVFFCLTLLTWTAFPAFTALGDHHPPNPAHTHTHTELKGTPENALLSPPLSAFQIINSHTGRGSDPHPYTFNPSLLCWREKRNRRKKRATERREIIRYWQVLTPPNRGASLCLQ